MTRIAYFINRYPAASHSFIRREILALERQGIEVQRIALRGWDADLPDAADLRERDATRYVLRSGVAALLLALLQMVVSRPVRFFLALSLALRMGVRADRPWPFHLIYLAEACRIVPWLKEFGARHIHAHFVTNSTEVVMLAMVLGGPSYSFTAHGPEEFDKPESLRIDEKVRRAAFVVAISSFGRSQLYRWVDHADWPKVHVVHCGLERAFHDVPRVPPPDRLRLVCVGRICEQKGQLLLVEAAALVARSIPGFELVLAGDGEMRKQVEALIVSHDLSGQIRITSWITSAQVRNEILSARALVQPSFAEGLPVAVMEAMALGRPVLTTQVAGIPELVRSGDNGWLFAAGSVDELAAAMEACLTLPVEELDRMGGEARRRVLERHDVDREATKLAALFRQAMGPSPGDAQDAHAY